MASSAWTKALAGVFLEPRPTGASPPDRGRHLEVVGESKSIRAPELVVVALDQRDTRTEQSTLTQAVETAALKCAASTGVSPPVIVFGGIEPSRSRGRRAKLKRIAVEGSRIAEMLGDEQPHVVLLDAESFQRVPVHCLVGTTIVGIGCAEEDPAYASLFAIETRARFPDAMVWAGSVGELTGDRSADGASLSVRRRSPGLVLGESLIALMAE